LDHQEVQQVQGVEAQEVVAEHEVGVVEEEEGVQEVGVVQAPGEAEEAMKVKAMKMTKMMNCWMIVTKT
jgi:hypothetical protein